MKTQADAASLIEEIESRTEGEFDSLRRLYEELHAHPEYSFQEAESAKRMAVELRQAGFETTEAVGGHGVVGVMRNGDGPVVMARTDMDALPIEEQTGLPYASKSATEIDGVSTPLMHACGHDMHMTVFSGTARLLSAMRERWSGTAVFVAQPAEEHVAGARAMVGDGLFERFPKPDCALALHVAPWNAVGQIGYTAGHALADVDSVDITVRGVGGHGAYPHNSKDPIVIASHLVMALQTIVSREIAALEPAVITVGSIHGGSQANIIPGEVKLELTVRCYTPQIHDQILAAIRRVANGVSRSFGVPEELAPLIETGRMSTPATYNSPQLTGRVMETFRPIFGSENVVEQPPSLGGEDFGVYHHEEPSMPTLIFWLGATSAEKIEESRKPGAEPLPFLHSPFFAPEPEGTIRNGLKAMTSALVDLFRGGVDFGV